MAIVTQPFNMALRPSQVGLAPTMKYMVELLDKSVPIDWTQPGVGIVERQDADFPDGTASYDIDVPNFNDAWSGRLVIKETTTPLYYVITFTPATLKPTEHAAIQSDITTATAAIKAKTDNLPAQPAAVGSAMGLADNAIKNATFQAGTTIPGNVTLSPDQMTTLVSSILRDNDPGNQDVPDSLGGVVKSSKGSYDSCYVDVSQQTPSTKKFQIRMAQASIDAGRSLPSGTGYKGLWLMFNGSANLAPSKLRIADYQLNEENLATVWFTEAFYGIPADGSTCEVG